jgi:hypothetical protein
MCIVYFASHPTCTHYHILGAWNCSLSCPTDTRHTFYITDNGFTCSVCDFLGGRELDPDKNPVEYYSPLFDLDEAKEDMKGVQKNKRAGTAGQEERPNLDIDVEDYKALSDPDSLTSEWRRTLSPSSPYENDELAQHFTQAGSHFFQATPQHPIHRDATPDTTPRTAAHRTLVQEQLDKLAAARRMEGQTQVHTPVPSQTDPFGNYVQECWDGF